MEAGRSRNRGAIGAEHIRRVMFGHGIDGVTVVRQARRLSADDSDELCLIDARGTWWVARRSSASVSTWLYIGDAEAEDGFERLATAAASGAITWTEAR